MHPSAIGPFRIERELGRGGMGEVFLGHDTRLDRPVAIKALPAHVAQDPDRLARFQREAKVLASLNHSGIGAIYGLEESNGNQYLILEYVEGATLADRLAKGPISVEESLAIARQIAEALEVAHEKGVVHRDLKPSNVMVTQDGAVKVLDFGLARTADGAPSTTNTPALSETPTLTSPARYAHSPTIPGVIMGSAGYMSPEQARGRPVDKRSDIFSFGCVLYEMLSGAGPFPGETVTDSLGAILHREPDWALLPPSTPARVRELLTSCLAKDRRSRLHDIGDARIAIERAIAEPQVAGGDSAPVPARGRWGGVLGAAALAALAIVASAMMFRPSREGASGPLPLLRATLALPNGMTLEGGERAVAVSPDGTRVVVSLAAKEGAAPASLFLRDLSRLEFRPLAGAEGASWPCWSPDGASIAFFANGQLKRLDLSDGIVRVLCDAPVGRGAAWSSKGTIVFAPSAGGGLQIVSDAGGTPTSITMSTSPGESHRLPQFLPDGERFLYYVQNSGADGVYAFDPATTQSRLVLEGWTEALFVEPGVLVFGRDGHLVAQPFDVQRLELTGVAKPIAPDVRYDKSRAYINAGLSSSGTLVYQAISSPTLHKLAWMDRAGNRTVLPVEPMSLDYTGATVSSDGGLAAVSLVGAREEAAVWLVDLERGVRTRLGDPAQDFTWGGLWTPGDQSIIATEVGRRKQALVNLPLGGGPGTVVVEAELGFELDATAITPGGKSMLYTQSPLRDKLPDIMSAALDGKEPPTRFMQTPAGEWMPRLSPAGDILAYFVAEEGDSSATLRVVTYPTPTFPVQVTVTPVLFDRLWWIGAGELAWVDTQRRMWSATITSKDGRIAVGAPKSLYEGRALDPQVRVLDFDQAHDRFLIAVEDTPREDPRLIVVSDWRPNFTSGARSSDQR